MLQTSSKNSVYELPYLGKYNQQPIHQSLTLDLVTKHVNHILNKDNIAGDLFYIGDFSSFTKNQITIVGTVNKMRWEVHIAQIIK